ncbi:MAG: 2-hydroxychromene-2-carboxylate isomerase [Parvularculaceae bacterium]
MVTPEFIFDFASPNAYLAHKVLPGIGARTGAAFDYVPCLLGGIFKATGNQSPMAANANIPAKMAYDMLEIRRFIDRHGLLRFQMNPHFPVNTLTIMRGAVAAKRAGVLPLYVEAAFRAMWEDGAKLDDPSVIVTMLTQAGLDAKALIEATQLPEIKAGLIANTERAVARGVFGIPAFFVGAEMWFGKDRLAQVEEAIVQG